MTLASHVAVTDQIDCRRILRRRSMQLRLDGLAGREDSNFIRVGSFGDALQVDYRPLPVELLLQLLCGELALSP